MIEFQHINKVFSDGTHALTDFSLKINEGELVTLIGPSGCGKTTTMKMINRLIKPTSGNILIKGKNIEDYKIHELRWNIGYVLQEIALFPHLTIEENIRVVPEMKKWHRNRIKKRTEELLEMVGLDPKKYNDRMPHELSGGQQQRVGVIRALAADPDIILMDEPFSALDPISREQLQKDIRQLQTEIQKTIVFVTHDMDEALALGDKVCLMREGKIVQIDTPQQLVLHPATPFAKKFIGGKKSLWHTAIDIIADRSLSRTITEEEYADDPDQHDGWHVIIADDDHYVGAIMNGERVELQTLPNDMKLYEATEHIQSSQQVEFPVLAGDRLVGILNYENIVAYFKDNVSIENGVIQT
ncbi:MAG TPA: ABC transporter ATP-binding protein [Virgibacillus sp.]|nr:ABC transporter ATP-binding protein [Virgibacillus sp.]